MHTNVLPDVDFSRMHFVKSVLKSREKVQVHVKLLY